MTQRPAWWRAYWRRHQHPASVALHVVGVPLCFAVAPAVAAIQLAHGMWDDWWRPAGLFALGYALQFAGHAIEGNDAGEACILLKALGLPFTAERAPQAQAGRSPELAHVPTSASAAPADGSTAATAQARPG